MMMAGMGCFDCVKSSIGRSHFAQHDRLIFRSYQFQSFKRQVKHDAGGGAEKDFGDDDGAAIDDWAGGAGSPVEVGGWFLGGGWGGPAWGFRLGGWAGAGGFVRE